MSAIVDYEARVKYHFAEDTGSREKREKMSSKRITLVLSTYLGIFLFLWQLVTYKIRNQRGDKTLLFHKRKHKSGVFQVISTDVVTVLWQQHTLHILAPKAPERCQEPWRYVWLIWRNFSLFNDTAYRFDQRLRIVSLYQFVLSSTERNYTR